ncbi:MAG: hypothetical protein ACYCPT_08145 [Acidimicrobiales bacterium]
MPSLTNYAATASYPSACARTYQVVRDLMQRIDEQRSALTHVKDELAHQLELIQQAVLKCYTTGETSIDDWLT